MKRMFAILIALSLLILPGAVLGAEDPAKDVEKALYSYFDMKYAILSSLTYDTKFEKLIDPAVLSSPDTISEADVLRTVVEYRKSQINDLRLDKYKYSLNFGNVKIESDKVTAVFSEDYELYFKCAPTVRSKASITHIVLLSKKDGSWLIKKDDYTDPDGIKLLLSDVFLSSDISREQAAGAVLSKLNTQADTRLEKLGVLLDGQGAGKFDVFCIGKNAAYISGKACRIDNNAGVLPLEKDGTALLPVRFTAEKLGAVVVWDGKTSTVSVSRQDHKASFAAGGKSIMLDGVSLELATPVSLAGGRLMLQADVLAKILGMSAYLDDSGVIILSGEASPGAPDKTLVSKIKGFFDVLYTKADFPHIDGSTATYPLSMEIGKELLGLDDTAVKGFITHKTTHNAYVNLIDGNADIIFVTQPSPEELELAAKSGIGLEVVPICSEGFVFLVNTENPVKNLTTKQVQDIYKGVFTNWKEVGGEDRAIIPYQREANSGSQTIMENTVMKGMKMMTPPKEVLVYGMGELIDRVADYSNSKSALGYSVYYYATTMYQSRNVRLLSIDGTTPSRDTIREGTYPFVVNYYAVIRKSEGENSSARRLLNWILGEEGQSLVDKAGFVSLKK